jgi:hypothetical protein
MLRGVGIGREPDQVTRYRDYGHAAAQAQGDQAATVEPLPGWQEVTFEEPGRSPSPIADVAVPFLQAIISGILAGAGAAIGAAKLANVDPALIGSVVGLVVSGVVWSRLLVDTRRLLRKMETWTREDLDGDGVAGEPQTETIRLEMHTHKPSGRQTLFSDVPVSKAKFKLWAQGVTGGRSLALGSWTGSKGPFSRSEYDALMDAMDRARVVAWNNPDSPRSGRKVTRMGKAALKAWLEAS